ncbi:MAG: hypothetical protein M2R45_01649 [Verrucomicrobia subdivision 3 bacterium]|nr:hypothetical protein [Limisphaerales bacterium]MCS1412800.1 hypothetical protein [Limisphaerales bacterium]
MYNFPIILESTNLPAQTKNGGVQQRVITDTLKLVCRCSRIAKPQPTFYKRKTALVNELQ